jgi:hypothetical protein
MPKWALLKGSIELSPYSPFYFDWWTHEGREVSCFCISYSSFWQWHKYRTSRWTGRATTCCSVLLNKLTAVQLVNNSQTFTKSESSWPCSQQPDTCPYPRPDESAHNLPS